MKCVRQLKSKNIELVIDSLRKHVNKSVVAEHLGIPARTLRKWIKHMPELAEFRNPQPLQLVGVSNKPNQKEEDLGNAS